MKFYRPPMWSSDQLLEENVYLWSFFYGFGCRQYYFLRRLHTDLSVFRAFYCRRLKIQNKKAASNGIHYGSQGGTFQKQHPCTNYALNF